MKWKEMEGKETKKEVDNGRGKEKRDCRERGKWKERGLKRTKEVVDG